MSKAVHEALSDAIRSGVTRWRPIEDADCVSGRPFVGMDTETGEMRLTWWGKTSHIPLYGWCHGDDPENIDLWSPTIVLPIPPPPAREE